MEFIKKNFKESVAAFLGLFHFVLLGFPFIRIYSGGLGEGMSQNLSGYGCFAKMMGELKAGSFLKISLIVFLIAALALLMIGVYLVLASLLRGKIDLPVSFGPIFLEKLCGWVHIGYAGTSVLTLLAAIIVSAKNTTNTEFLGVSMSVGVAVGFGAIFGVLLSIGSILAGWLMEKKPQLGEIVDIGFNSRFACSECGEAAKKGSGFCSRCGGKVVEIVPTKPMCTACGAPAKKGDVFCSHCGGKVEEVAQTKPVCETCGAPAKNGAAFCSLCGGKIVQK